MELHTDSTVQPARRDFLKKLAAIVIGGLVAVVPGLAGLMVYLDPIRKKRAATAGAADAGFIHVTPLSSLPADGIPRKFQVLAERIDAWNKHPASPVGAVYLKRAKETPDEVIAFNVVCPHAGCFVEPASAGAFRCPCHNSAFNSDGSIVPGQCVSPRGLDQLAVDPEALKAGAIRIRFQNFIAGTHEKIPS